ncbi:MAG: hypothetical protein H0U70_10835 [Tatlockia sp.]|nr:hypothetical protein [Tatlockia sp.]
MLNSQTSLKTSITFILSFSLLLCSLAVFVPLSPKMPAASLDSSWALALNQAVAQGLAFGSEIIFTLGPYSSIYTKNYHPATDWLMIGGSFYLALCYWLALVFLLGGYKLRWYFAFFVFLAGMIYSRDSLFFSYTLLVSLVCLKLSQRKLTIASSGLLAFLFSTLGLLTLIKGSFALLSLVIAFMCFSFLLISKKQKEAIISLLAFISAIVFFWLGSGQLLQNLPLYYYQTFSLAAGFSEAMGISGSNIEIAIYLVNAILILLALVYESRFPKHLRLFLFIVFFSFFFISFKAAFTRHYGHAFIAGTSVLIAALCLIFIVKRKSLLPLIFLSYFTWSFINGNYSKISLGNNLQTTYSSTWNGLNNRLSSKYWYSRDFELSLAYLHQQTPFPSLKGTTDIYSFAQSYLISSANTWFPRPLFQSYSVFNSTMIEKNKTHLSVNKKPDNIIFRLEPIDNRFPTLEDGASWPLLIANYQPQQAVNNFLILKRKTRFSDFEPKLLELPKEAHHLGEQVIVPNANQALFVELEISSTYFGKIINFLFKINELTINLLLNDGSKRQYRLIASMANSGFLLSPLIESTQEFALLYGEPLYLDIKKVQSFIINTKQSRFRHWHSNYHLRFKLLTKFN